MVLMKKTKPSAHEILHHGKPVPMDTVLDVDRRSVGKFKDAGFEEVTAEQVRENKPDPFAEKKSDTPSRKSRKKNWAQKPEATEETEE